MAAIGAQSRRKILQGLGVTSGVPDVIAVKDGRCYALELKAEGGKLTEAQEHVLIKLREAGAMATHAHGLDQANRASLRAGDFCDSSELFGCAGAPPPRSHSHRHHWRDNLANRRFKHE